MLNFVFFCILYVYVYVLCELFFPIDNVVRLLSYVNMCACHVYFTTSLLTYLLERTDGHDRSHYLPANAVGNRRRLVSSRMCRQQYPRPSRQFISDPLRNRQRPRRYGDE